MKLDLLLPTTLVVHPHAIDAVTAIPLPGPWRFTTLRSPAAVLLRGRRAGRQAGWLDQGWAHQLCLQAQLQDDAAIPALKAIYRRVLPTVFAADQIISLRPDSQQQISVRVSIPLGEHPLLHAGQLALRFARADPRALQPEAAAIVSLLRRDATRQAQTHTTDLFNAAVLALAATQGPLRRRIQPHTVARWFESPALVAAMAASWAAQPSACLDGSFSLDAPSWQAITLDDLDHLRSVGIDPLIFDVLAGQPQPHLVPRQATIAQARSELGPRPDLECFFRTLSADPPPAPVRAPLGRTAEGLPRLSMPRLGRLRRHAPEHFPHRYFTVSTGVGTIDVVFPSFLPPLLRGLHHLFASDAT